MKVNIVFDGPPSAEGPRFIETEDEHGNGIGVGEWIQDSPRLGQWSLQINVNEEDVRR